MTLNLERLEKSHLPALIALVAEGTTEYSKYFTPFEFTLDTFERILRGRREDKYFAVLKDGEVCGFYMLRGFDDGYSIPSYGVWIAEKFRGQGLAQSTLGHAVEICRRLGCSELMLKVHPDNVRAKSLYERFGFVQTSFDEKNRNLVYKFVL